MILAAIDGDWIVPLVVVIFGFINWVVGKLKGEQPAPPPARAAPTEAPRPSGNPEEDRMRKFLEALGVPDDEAPAPVRPTPPRAQPPPLRREPPIVRPPVVLPVPVAPLPPLVPVERSLDEDPAPTLPVEQIHVRELVVPTFEEFKTVSSSIGAIPQERRPALAAVSTAAPASTLVRQQLSSPEQLRSAFLLREILGAPRSLQS